MIGAVPATWMSRPTAIARQNPTLASYGDPDAMRRRSTRLVSPPVDALRQIERWECGFAAAAAVAPTGVLAAYGDTSRSVRWASVTKLLAAYAGLLAAEEGILDLDEPAGPPGSTVRHLLAHASGLPFEGDVPIGRPGERRIYSNTGIEVFADHLAERAGMPFGDYLSAGVLVPLGLTGELAGSPAQSFHGSLDDLSRFAQELLEPRLLAPETLAEATSVQFPGLGGVLPGLGRQEPNDWGLGFELRDAKQPHWTGTSNSPRTYGHFGGSGTFLWVDPERRVALACLTDREFGDWALEAWPALSDAVLAEIDLGSR
jgi:CubicO group peptidase (beta-lactamase class C family)